MRTDLKFREMLLATVAAAALSASGAGSALASDTEALLTLLASKGVISSSEARSITSAPPVEQGDRLVAILRKKGVLADSDVQRLKSKPLPASVAATSPAPAPAVAVPPAPAPAPAPAPMPRKAPIEIAGFEITPVGYLALTGGARATNTGNVTTSNFGGVPFDNTIQGNIGESRLTAQNTQLGLRAHGAVGGIDLTGYFEGDFNGNNPTNVFVNSNSHTFRMRLAYADVNAGRFETTFGQVYSWLTPNRLGMGPDPADIFLTNNIDQSFQVGLPWARQAAAHFTWHATQQFSFGAGVENPDQFTNGEVTFPFAFNAQLSPQFDAGTNPAAPNKSPDVVAKAAFDDHLWSAARLHLEAAGMWRHFEITNLPLGGTGFASHSTNGWIGTVAGNLELFDRFAFVGNAFWSNGGGRYLGALGPDVVATLTGSPGAYDLGLSTVASHGYLAGVEWRVLPTTLLSTYYGQAAFDSKSILDVTSPQVTQPYVGFGGLNSSNTNNKQIEEWTVDLQHTFWANPYYGSVVGLLQYSYLRREAWFVANGAPPEAHTHLFLTELRYQLPGN